MRKSVLALLLACVCTLAVAQQEVQVPDLDQPAGVCADCPDPGEGGGGNGTPPPPPPPSGQPYVNNGYANDPNEGVLETVVKKPGYSNLSVVVDRSTDRIYMNNGNAVFDLPLNTFALDAYPTDAVARQNFLNRIRGGLTGEINISQGTVTATQGIMHDGSGPPRAPCDYRCYFVVDTYWTGGGVRYGYDGGGYSQNQLDIDRALFEYKRTEACANRMTLKQNYALSLGTAFVACYSIKASAGSGWAKGACGLSLGAMLVARDQLVDANQTCAQGEYPGPGRWHKGY